MFVVSFYVLVLDIVVFILFVVVLLMLVILVFLLIYEYVVVLWVRLGDMFDCGYDMIKEEGSVIIVGMGCFG